MSKEITSLRRLVAAAQADFDHVGTIADLRKAAAAVPVAQIEELVAAAGAAAEEICGQFESSSGVLNYETGVRLRAALAGLADPKEKT